MDPKEVLLNQNQAKKYTIKIKQEVELTAEEKRQGIQENKTKFKRTTKKSKENEKKQKN